MKESEVTEYIENTCLIGSAIGACATLAVAPQRWWTHTVTTLGWHKI